MLSPLLIVFLVVVAGVGTLGTLYAMGEIDLASLSPAFARSTEKPPDMRGMVPVPISATTIPAYSVVDIAHIWDPVKKDFTVVHLPPDRVPDGVITDVTKIRGRVLRKDKAANLAFTENDFFPRGTRPGLTAGIPPGKRAMRLEASKVRGFHGLNQGDRFDIVSTIPVEDENDDLSNLGVSGALGKQLEIESKLARVGKQAEVKVVVQNGTVVQAVEARAEPYTVNSLMDGTRFGTRPVQEIVIAIDPEEVAPLTAALAVKADLMCIPRSGHPDDPEDSVTPDLIPKSPFSAGGTEATADGEGSGDSIFDSLKIIERISGNGRGTKREVQAVPDPKGRK